MKKKILVTEEQLKYIINFIGSEGDLVNEQVKVDLEGPTKGVDVKTPIGGFGISRTAGKEKSGELSDKNTSSYLFRYNRAKDTNNQTAINGINKLIQKEWLPNESIVRKKLSGEDQIAIWDEILKNDIYLAADTIKYVKTHDWVGQVIVGKKGEKMKEPGSDTPPTEKPIIPALIISTTEKIDTSDYYLDNSWTLTPAGVEDIEENFILPILETKEKSIYSCINYIKIDTSASRFRNTGQASNMTFEELSKKRSDATYEYVIGRLKEIGITNWCDGEKITLNYKGENGDGTSGPNPPSGNYYVPKDGVSSQAVLDDKNRGEFGTPHKSKSEYNVHKYNRLSVGIGFDFEVPPEENDPDRVPPVDPFKEEKTKYNVKFYGKTKGKWKFKWNKIQYRRKTKKPRNIDVQACRAPGSRNKKVANWIKRGLEQ